MVLYEIVLPFQLSIQGDVLPCSRSSWNNILLTEKFGVSSLLRELTTIQGSQECKYKCEAVVPFFIIPFSLPQWTLAYLEQPTMINKQFVECKQDYFRFINIMFTYLEKNTIPNLIPQLIKLL